MKFYEDHKGQRDQFEIVAIHDHRAKSFEDLDAKIKEKDIINKRWGGKDLPFPVLLDPENKTTKAYGIQAFPTVILIDPDGKLVKGGSEKMLAEKLRALMDEKETKGDG